ncbi:unnamed protein product [Rotaria socialis]|uniref:Ankyrin repeat domain-containing protein n=1 Tax=Rotaria socialis TaxID=392032 RepID=A0A820PMG1_9BILA|nr:unnamed protein product [Rotaria socialis]
MNIEREFPLHVAIWNNEIDKLAELIKHDKDRIEQFDPRHRTPIQLAVCLGRVEAARLLAQNDADCNAVSKDGWNLLQEAIANGNPSLVKLIMKYRNYQRNIQRIRGIPELLRKLKESPDFYVEMKWEFSSWVPLVSKLCPNDTYKIYKSGPNVRVDTTLLGIEGTNWQRGNRTFIFSLLADCAKMIDIDHETKSAFSENLSIPGEEAILLEPNMDQIDSKLMSPNLTGVWGMRSEKTENINGYACKVYTANNFELVTRNRIEHMSPDDRKAYEAGHSSNRNFLGGVFNFLESSASSSSSKATTAAAAGNASMATNASAATNVSASKQSNDSSKYSNQAPVTLEEYFNSRVELKNRDIGRAREENVKIQTFNAQISLCDEYPLSLQEQILPIIDLMAISNSHFKKLRDFVTLQIPNGFPVKIQIPLYHVLTAKVTFGNIHGIDKTVDGVSTIKEDSISFCAVDENIFAVPAGYRRQGEGEGYHPMMYADDDALLQMAIERSLLDSNETNPTNDAQTSSDQVTLYEALGHAGNRGNRTDIANRYVDYDLQRALEESLLTSVMELSKHEEEARLNRLREEEEELEKIHMMSPSPKSPEEKKTPDDENLSNDELSHPPIHTHHDYIASTDESPTNSDDEHNNNNNINQQYENLNGYCLLPQESDMNQQQNDEDSENGNGNEDDEDDDDEFLRFATLRVHSSIDENKGSQTMNSALCTNEAVWSTKLESESFPVDDDKANYIKNLMSSVKLPESSIPMWAQFCTEQDWQEKLRERIACRQTTFFLNEKN